MIITNLDDGLLILDSLDGQKIKNSGSVCFVDNSNDFLERQPARVRSTETEY